MSFEGNFNPLNKPKEIVNTEEETTIPEHDGYGIDIEASTPAEEYYGRYKEIRESQDRDRKKNKKRKIPGSILKAENIYRLK